MIFIFKLVLTADLYVPDHPTRKRRNSRAENSRKVDFEKIQCRAKSILGLQNLAHTHHCHLPARFPFPQLRLIMITSRLSFGDLKRLKKKKWKNVYVSSRKGNEDKRRPCPRNGFASQACQKVKEKKGGKRRGDALRASEKKEVTFWS